MSDVARPEGWFVGDLDDPWVASIAGCLPGSFAQYALVGDLPESAPWERGPGSVLVLHRPTLSQRDHERLKSYRATNRFARVILCVGPHARHAQVQQWSEVVDVVLAEATASETIARYIEAGSARQGFREAPRVPPQPVVIVGTDRELSRWLEDVCTRFGFRPIPRRSWAEAPEGPIALWHAPVLEPRWTDQLAEAAGQRRVVALIGLADRELVRLARSSGAAACLDLPCDPEDLAFVLGRLAGDGVDDRKVDAPRHQRCRTSKRARRRFVAGLPRRPYNIGGAPGRPRFRKRTSGSS